MGASHRHHMAALQHMFTEPLRPAGVGQARVEDGLHQREFGRAIGQACAADHVADHKHVGFECQLVSPKTFHQVNAQRPELVTHRGVDAGVAAGDGVARFARQCGHATHKSAADAEYVNVHARILRGLQAYSGSGAVGTGALRY